MTSYITHRCDHCGSKYYYQASGYGCGKESNDPTYCPDCAPIIKNAEKQARSILPIKFEKEWVLTNEVNLQTLLKTEKEQDEKNRKEGKIIFKRVLSNLYNFEKGIWSKSGYVRHDGKQYRYHYWPGEEDRAEIKVEMERNLETGQLVPWKNY